MNTTEQLFAAISALVLLQNRLVDAFRAAFPQVNDWKLLLDFPKTGTLILEGEAWSFRKHGRGVSFLSSAGTCVDIHRGLLNPDAIDAWRVLQYLESIDVHKRASTTERDIEEQLRQLCLAGRLEAFGDGAYCLAKV